MVTKPSTNVSRRACRDLDKPFVFALAKGRGRYVCKLKLERLVGNGGVAEDLFDADIDAPKPAKFGSVLSQEEAEERRIRLYETMASMLAASSWDGDRDSLSEAPDARDW